MKRWAEESLAVPKMVTIVVQDFVSSPKLFIYFKVLSFSTSASDVEDFINHGDEKSLSSSETQSLCGSLVRRQRFRSEPSTQMWVQSISISKKFGSHLWKGSRVDTYLEPYPSPLWPQLAKVSAVSSCCPSNPCHWNVADRRPPAISTSKAWEDINWRNWFSKYGWWYVSK